MKILLINICLRPKSEKIIFPIGIAYIGTAIKNAGHDLIFYDLDALRPTDQEIEEYIKNTECDAVAMGSIVTGYKHVKKLCEIIKKYKKVPIIVGNSVATSIPEILLKNTKADIGVVREGDITIVELLRAIENKTPLEDVRGIFFRKDNKVFFTEERELISDLSTLPMIQHDIFDMDTYLRKCKYSVSEPYPIEFDKIMAIPVNTARGCIFNCTFCYHVFKNKKYRTRPIQNICEEIRHLQKKYKVNYIQFCDELTLYSREQALEFANGIIQSGLKFWWAADCRAGLFGEGDLDLALKLKEAGCVDLGYSLESADKDILKDMNKHITVEQFIIQTKILQKVGILPTTSIVIGYPKETLETLQKTFDVCYDLEIYPSTGYLLPQPGTIMYDYAKEKGIIKDEEEYLLKIGDRQDFTINLTDSLTKEQIEETTIRNLKRIADKLKLGLDQGHLLNTGHYRQKYKA
ncbi:MAG: radical SAM protein [Patescibacteria group bacterium]